MDFINRANNFKISLFCLVSLVLLSGCSTYIYESNPTRDEYDNAILENNIDENLKDVSINKTLFQVGIIENKYVDSEETQLELYIKILQTNESIDKVIINYAQIHENNAINLDSQYININQLATFSDWRLENVIEANNIPKYQILDSSINEQDDAQILVTLNVSVENNGILITKDILFEIKCEEITMLDKMTMRYLPYLNL